MHSLTRFAIGILAVALAAAGMVGDSLLGLHQPGAEGQATTTLAVDADPAGNLPTSVSQIDDCLVLDVGQTAEIDIVILNVSDLLAFELTFRYDPSIVEIAATPRPDIRRQFLASASGSRVIDVSEGLPDPDRLHLFAAADIGEDSRESGSGVLARITLIAKGTGVSSLSIPKIDVNGDGKINLGPRLIGPEGAYIVDQDGDQFFDGPSLAAQIAVDTACSPEPPTPDGGGSSDDVGSPDGDSSSDGVGSPDGNGSGTTGDEAVSLIPPIPPEISDSVPLGASAGPDNEGEPSDDDPSGGDSTDGDNGSGAADDSSSSSGSRLPLWLIVAIPVTMLVFGGSVIARAMLARR